MIAMMPVHLVGELLEGVSHAQKLNVMYCSENEFYLSMIERHQ